MSNGAMKVLQVNSVLRAGSTGRIVEALHRELTARGHVGLVAYGRGTRVSLPGSRRIGSPLDVAMHGLATRILDAHGYGSRSATDSLLEFVVEAEPDVIHLHNLHGYYLNIERLFAFVREKGIPVLWTLHDCWAFTGHCAYFDLVGCRKWMTRCFSCPQTSSYPASWWIDRSGSNFDRKKRAFTGVSKLTIVVPSAWLAGLVARSFLGSYPVRVVPNGIDVGVFVPCDSERVRASLGIPSGTAVVLAVAADFKEERKGIRYLHELARSLPKNFACVLVGGRGPPGAKWPDNVVWVERTTDVSYLASLYSLASVFVNPTLEDNFPTVNLEALACGTPVVTFSAGGSPEQVDTSTGAVVKRGDSMALTESVVRVAELGKDVFSDACRSRALRFANAAMCRAYLELYDTLANSSR